MASIHQKETFKCKECDKQLSSKGNLYKHTQIHEENLVKKIWKLSLYNNRSYGTTSDQTIEAMHSYVDKLIKRSMYHVKAITKNTLAKNNTEEFLRINAYSVKIKK